MAGWLEGEALHGTLWRAGLPKTFRDRAPAAAPDVAARGPTGRASRPLPLDGIRVVEFTHMVMGPTCGMILADLGAEVIKIEPPGGDKTRKLPGLGIGFFRTSTATRRASCSTSTRPRATPPRSS